jgi:hypothetical protein
MNPSESMKYARLLLASLVLAACAGGPRRSGHGDLRLDTETVSRIRHAAALGEGASSAAPGATRAVVSSLVRSVPEVLALLEGEGAAEELEERLVECARQAELQVNFSHFGNRAPTREECGQEVEVDGCDAPITRAMLLGRQKHVLALECAREVLEQLWPAPFSLEQRYRYYVGARFLELITAEEEARLIAQGCTRELWRTIKPDIVLHADRNLLRAALVLDFKFPCPGTNRPQWKDYGENSAYTGYNQGEIYQRALGGRAVIISPQRGLSP